ncbi:hypothetical protein Q1695_002468 [Nippostrongylus brasiliensis]|nr:hypothetical protein Q1695_002468 [Nippostrongylus brasiliensis]
MRTTTSRLSSLVFLLLLTVNVVYSCVDVLFVLDPTTEVSRHRATKVASELSKRDGLRSSVVVRRPNGHYVFMMTKKAGDLITTLDTLDGDYDHYLTMVTSEIMRRRHVRPLVILLFSETAVNSSLSSTWKQFSRDKKVHVFRVGTAKPSNELSADEGESFEEILSCSAITKPLGDVRRRPAISEVEQSSTTVRPRTLPFSKTTRRPTTTRPVTTTGPKLHPVFHHKVPSQEEIAAQDLPSDGSSAFSEKNSAPLKVLSKRPSHGGGFDIAQQQHLTIDATNRIPPTTTGSTPRRHSLTPTTPFAYPTKRHTISPLPSNFASTHLPQFSRSPDKNTAETAQPFHHSTSSIHIPNPTTVPPPLAPTQVAPAAFRDILPSPDAFDKRLEPGLEVRAPEATHPSPHAPVILHNRELVLASSPVPQSSSLGQEILPDVNDLDHDEITTVIPHSAPAFRPFSHVIPTSTSAAIIVHDALPPSTTPEPPVETSSHFNHVDSTGTHLATTHASSRDPTPTTPYIPPSHQGTTPQVFPIQVTTPTIPTPASFPIRLASLSHPLSHIQPSRTTPTPGQPRLFSFKTTSFSRSPTSTTPFRPAVVHTTLRVSSSPRFTATPRRFSPFTARAQQGFAPAFTQR